MADASNGVSGSDSSRSAAEAASRAAETAAAQQAAADKAAADAVAAAALDPNLTAPVDLSISPAALSQLNAMTVDTVPNLSSFNTLGGVPTPTTYADVAQKPAAPAIDEYNAWSPTFNITPNDPAAVAKAALSDVSVNFGLNYVGDVNASIEARMGIAPAQVTFAGAVSYTNGIDSYGISAFAGPFGGVAEPNFGATVTAAKELDFGKLDASLSVQFNPSGFTAGSFNTGISAPLSVDWSGYARVGVGVDQQGINSVNGVVGAEYKADGTSFSVNGSGRVDTFTGDFSGRAGFNLDIKF